MEDDTRWHGYDTADIYAAQDDCLIAIRDKKPLPVALLQRIPPIRALLIAGINELAKRRLEKGTYAQLEAEAKVVGGSGKLGEWWNR